MENKRFRVLGFRGFILPWRRICLKDSCAKAPHGGGVPPFLLGPWPYDLSPESDIG